MLAQYSWLWWILIGFVAGGIAKLIMPGRDPGGCIITILLGTTLSKNKARDPDKARKR